MKTFGYNRNARLRGKLYFLWQQVAILAVLAVPPISLSAQATQPSVSAQIQQLTRAFLARHQG